VRAGASGDAEPGENEEATTAPRGAPDAESVEGTRGTDRVEDVEVVEGIDVKRVSDWLIENVEGTAPPFGFDLIAGGRSNLTYRVTDAAGRSLALRRPPLSHVLPTAHDMSREHRVITALGPTPVPVPRTHGLCTDPTVNRQPFYVMEFVEGHIIRDAQIAESVLDQSARHRAGESMAVTLANLHAVGVDEVGLGDFAKREGYIERQLRRWYEQFRNSQVEGRDTSAAVGAVHDKLAATMPEQVGASIVHGDFRIDNAVLGDDGSVRAVLDWEICTLGDPLADMGLLMVYWAEPGDEAALLGVTPTTVPGFPSRATMRQIYSAESGRDVSNLDYYEAFGYWKLACIVQGVYARYAGGAAAGDRSSVEPLGDSVVRLAELALLKLEGD
jgi:aminoglycoside phosphotransferase (APT) family kinase protein